MSRSGYPLLNGLYGNASGTSLSAAQTAGAAALLFEWAVIRGNQPYFTGSSVKNYITRGAEREERMQYPQSGLGIWENGSFIIHLSYWRDKNP